MCAVYLTASLETRSSSRDGELAQIVSRALGETLLEFFYKLVRHALNALAQPWEGMARIESVSILDTPFAAPGSCAKILSKD